jgi:hypothetical protein
MALLSTVDSNIFSLATQYATVSLQAFRLLPRWFRENALGAWHRGVLKLLLKSVTFQHKALSQWFRDYRPVAR